MSKLKPPKAPSSIVWLLFGQSNAAAAYTARCPNSLSIIALIVSYPTGSLLWAFVWLAIPHSLCKVDDLLIALAPKHSTETLCKMLEKNKPTHPQPVMCLIHCKYVIAARHKITNLYHTIDRAVYSDNITTERHPTHSTMKQAAPDFLLACHHWQDWLTAADQDWNFCLWRRSADDFGV